MGKKTVVVRLTPEEADILWRNIDGIQDAGACEDGLREDEQEALESVSEQLSRQLHPEAWKRARRTKLRA